MLRHISKKIDTPLLLLKPLPVLLGHLNGHDPKKTTLACVPIRQFFRHIWPQP